MSEVGDMAGGSGDEPGRAYDLLIVGAGAAGLWAAGTAARRARELGRPLRLAVVDSMERIGTKILMSGGTRCNLTHVEVRAEDYRGGNRNLIRRTLRAHPPRAFLDRLTDELAVPVALERETGKLFPADDRAATVLSALVADLTRHGVPVLGGRRCVGLRVAGKAWTVQAVGPGGAVRPDLLARRVLLCTGGRSYPKTGSDGAMWDVLRALGHTIVEPVPALSPFVLGSDLYRSLSGVSCNVELRLVADGRRVAEAAGALLFTHVGVSGPAVLDLSGHWARRRADHPGETLEVVASFLPGETPETLRARWIETGRARPSATPRYLLDALPHRLADVLVEALGGDPGAPLALTPRRCRQAIVDGLCRHRLPVTGVRGFAQAEVTSGGVPLEETDRGLESRRLSGVHLAGEMLHVDGRLGGFNFQWAWSSSFVAARAAVDRLLGRAGGGGSEPPPAA